MSAKHCALKAEGRLVDEDLNFNNNKKSYN